MSDATQSRFEAMPANELFGYLRYEREAQINRSPWRVPGINVIVERALSSPAIGETMLSYLVDIDRECAAARAYPGRGRDLVKLANDIITDANVADPRGVLAELCRMIGALDALELSWERTTPRGLMVTCARRGGEALRITPSIGPEHVKTSAFDLSKDTSILLTRDATEGPEYTKQLYLSSSMIGPGGRDLERCDVCGVLHMLSHREGLPRGQGAKFWLPLDPSLICMEPFQEGRRAAFLSFRPEDVTFGQTVGFDPRIRTIGRLAREIAYYTWSSTPHQITTSSLLSRIERVTAAAIQPLKRSETYPELCICDGCQTLIANLTRFPDGTMHFTRHAASRPLITPPAPGKLIDTMLDAWAHLGTDHRLRADLPQDDEEDEVFERDLRDLL